MFANISEAQKIIELWKVLQISRDLEILKMGIVKF